jgi:LPPG:FO 2-phospho-L-lactate transferase
VRRRLGVPSRLLPMTDDTVRTIVDTDTGPLEFQEYFVARRAEPRVRAIRYEGADSAAMPGSIAAALGSPALRAIVICPSNPWLSIDPILAVPGLADRLRGRGLPIVGVSPLIAGQAVKGPTAKICAELGLESTPAAIAGHYAPLLDGLVLDEADRDWQRRCGCATLVTPTLMRTLEDRQRLAATTLEFAARLRS